MNDWMRSVKGPNPYRIGSPFRVSVSKFAQNWSVSILFLVFFLSILFFFHGANKSELSGDGVYNYTYPLSKPHRSLNGDLTYKIAIISDLDTESKSKDGDWISHMKMGWLTISNDMRRVQVVFEEIDYVLRSFLSLKGRAMELSELVVFNGKLYTCDDRTGVIFEITDDKKVLPFVLLTDGNGKNTKGFKCEWMAVKDESLWVGGLGKEWTNNNGVVLNRNPQWVKVIGRHGNVQHHQWIDNYNILRDFGGFKYPGYMIHEAVSWSAIRKQWVFLPRRASTLVYNDVEDEKRAANLVFFTDHAFNEISMQSLGMKHESRGFSSFKFIPGTSDTVVLVLKSEELMGRMASYLSAFNLETGDELMQEIKVGDLKFEGVEFV